MSDTCCANMSENSKSEILFDTVSDIVHTRVRATCIKTRSDHWGCTQQIRWRPEAVLTASISQGLQKNLQVSHLWMNLSNKRQHWKLYYFAINEFVFRGIFKVGQAGFSACLSAFTETFISSLLRLMCIKRCSKCLLPCRNESLSRSTISPIFLVTTFILA